MLHRIQTDNEVERANLCHQLQTKEILIKECVEAGDVLLEDLDGLKRQLHTMPFSLNWTKFKVSLFAFLGHSTRIFTHKFSTNLTLSIIIYNHWLEGL